MTTAYLICCYGMYDPSVRTDTEMEGLQEYFRACAEGISEQSGGRGKISSAVAAIILCGGVTNSNAEISEAASSRPFFLECMQRHMVSPEQKILLSESSHNLAQNIVHGLQVMHDQHIKADRVVVMCDLLRLPKALVIVEYLKQRDLQVASIEVQGFQRQDIHPNSTWPVQLRQALAFAENSQLIEEQLQV